MANVWTQMGYVPPRGQCNFKQGIVSGRCPCLRFMLHPLKSSSSYECDGCAHHASFHSMENKVEDEIRKQWEREAKDKAEHEQEVAERTKKRPRAIGYLQDSEELATRSGFGALLGGTSGKENVAKTQGGAPGRTRKVGGRPKGRIADVTAADDEVLDLD